MKANSLGKERINSRNVPGGAEVDIHEIAICIRHSTDLKLKVLLNRFTTEVNDNLKPFSRFALKGFQLNVVIMAS